MNVLGGGLSEADNYEDASTVLEAELAMLRRLGESEAAILGTRSNLAITYEALGRHEEALSMQQGVYSGYLRLKGEEDENTLREANNYAESLNDLKRFEEAHLRKTIPVVRRVFLVARVNVQDEVDLRGVLLLTTAPHSTISTRPDDEETTRIRAARARWRAPAGGGRTAPGQAPQLHARETGDMSAIREAHRRTETRGHP